MPLTTENIMDNQEPEAEVFEFSESEESAVAELALPESDLFTAEYYREMVTNSRRQRIILHDPDGFPSVPYNVNGIPFLVPTGTPVDVPELLYNAIRDNAEATKEAGRTRRRLTALGQMRDPETLPSLSDVASENARAEAKGRRR